MSNHQSPPTLAAAMSEIVRAEHAHVEAIRARDLPAVVETARRVETARLEGSLALTPPERCCGSDVAAETSIVDCPGCGKVVGAARDSAVTAVAIANGAWAYRIREHTR